MLVVLAMFAWLAGMAWLRPLMAPDEGRYAGVAFEMLRSGDWLVPRLNGLPFFHKPPLFYWIAASAMSLFGISEWAARLPSVIGATIAAAGLWLFVRRWMNETLALWSVAVVGTMPFFYVGAQFANLDMLVAGCISATLLLAAHAVLAREASQPFRWPLAGAFAMAALGVLSKGLIGLVLPGLVFLAWCGATGRLRCVSLLAWPPGWAIFVLLAGPWFVLMQLRYPEFFDYFIVTQHVRRFAASGFNNERPFWFYLPVVAGLTLPWFGWLAVGVWRRRGIGGRLSDTDWLMAIWLVVVMVFFSMPRSKLIGYVLPALPPLAYFIARGAVLMRGAIGPSQRGLRWTAGSAAALCIASVSALGILGAPPGHGLRLPAAHAVGARDEVLMLDTYVYELPFYWRLQRPVSVFADWRPEVANARDNWRKELGDAARFEPALHARVLIDPSGISALLCGPQVVWIVAAPEAQAQIPWLADAELVASNDHLAVWRSAGGNVTARAHCLETPRAGSPGTSVPP